MVAAFAAGQQSGVAQTPGTTPFARSTPTGLNSSVPLSRTTPASAGAGGPPSSLAGGGSAAGGGNTLLASGSGLPPQVRYDACCCKLWQHQCCQKREGYRLSAMLGYRLMTCSRVCLPCGSGWRCWSWGAEGRQTNNSRWEAEPGGHTSRAAGTIQHRAAEIEVSLTSRHLFGGMAVIDTNEQTNLLAHAALV